MRYKLTAYGLLGTFICSRIIKENTSKARSKFRDFADRKYGACTRIEIQEIPDAGTRKPDKRQAVDAFIDYFFEFYGEQGLYPFQGFKLTRTMVEHGIKLRGANFEGDTLDREAIRDIILTANNQLAGAFDVQRRAEIVMTKGADNET